MPVCNGASFLDQTITSLIDQDTDDWELVIVENASDDDSLRIAESWAARDARIRVVKQPRRVDIFSNWHAAFRELRSPFITFLAADDPLVSRDFLRRGAEVLAAAPDLIGVVPAFDLIDESGRVRGRVEHDSWAHRPWEQVKRDFFDIERIPDRYYAAYGMYRRERFLIEELRGTTIDGTIYSTACEFAFLANLVLGGRLQVVGEIRRSHRIHRRATSQKELIHQHRVRFRNARIMLSIKGRILAAALDGLVRGRATIGCVAFALSNFLPRRSWQELRWLPGKVAKSVLRGAGFRLMPLRPRRPSDAHVAFWNSGGAPARDPLFWTNYTGRYVLGGGRLLGRIDASAESSARERLSGLHLVRGTDAVPGGPPCHVIWVGAGGWDEINRMSDSLLGEAKLVVVETEQGARGPGCIGDFTALLVGRGLRLDGLRVESEDQSRIVATFCRDQ